VVHQPFCAVEMLKLVPLLDLGDEVERSRQHLPDFDEKR
jgi:hypothetical protein